MTSEHALHGSKVISHFPPQRVLNNLGVLSTSDVFPLLGSNDMHFSEHPENNSLKKATANPIFSSARAGLLLEVSPSPSSYDVGILQDGGPNAGVSFSFSPFVPPFSSCSCHCYACSTTADFCFCCSPPAAVWHCCVCSPKAATTICPLEENECLS